MGYTRIPSALHLPAVPSIAVDYCIPGWLRLRSDISTPMQATAGKLTTKAHISFSVRKLTEDDMLLKSKSPALQEGSQAHHSQHSKQDIYILNLFLLMLW